MKYLFFDIECANCFGGTGKICEFGYVLTNEYFDEIEKKIFLINPDSDFDWYVAKNMLAYDKIVYKKSPKYPQCFKDIQPLFCDEDILVVGHTVDADIKYLNDEATRYGLPHFECKFYDAKYMYNTYTGNPNGCCGVAAICSDLHVAPPKHEHRSVDDAYATMLIVKEICNRMRLGLAELIQRCTDCVGETKDGVVTTVQSERARIKREEKIKLFGTDIKNNFVRGKNKIMFLRFLDGVAPQKVVSNNLFSGKKLCISMNFEYSHYTQMLAIVQLLANCGCKYVLMASKADFFVVYPLKDDEGNDVHCSREQFVDEAIQKGKPIKKITFEAMMDILCVTMDDIQAMPYPDVESFLPTKKERYAKRQGRGEHGEYSSGVSATNSIGDILKHKADSKGNNKK